MKKQDTLKPGTPAPNSGQYVQIGPKGKVGTEITAVQGKPLPPTQTPGTVFKLVDKTKHKK